jgi:hypothetical protein
VARVCAMRDGYPRCVGGCRQTRRPVGLDGCAAEPHILRLGIASDA